MYAPAYWSRQWSPRHFSSRIFSALNIVHFSSFSTREGLKCVFRFQQNDDVFSVNTSQGLPSLSTASCGNQLYSLKDEGHATLAVSLQQIWRAKKKKTPTKRNQKYDCVAWISCLFCILARKDSVCEHSRQVLISSTRPFLITCLQCRCRNSATYFFELKISALAHARFSREKNPACLPVQRMYCSFILARLHMQKMWLPAS